MRKTLFLISTFYCLHFINGQSQNQIFSYKDVYDIQYVSDPQISPSEELLLDLTEVKSVLLPCPFL
ncbi:MAG: hypothetical protein P8L83_00420 [Flavobacteriaceae bacterium]|nr:hypothetical protein [Flavobacteriaceae bacterium]